MIRSADVPQRAQLIQSYDVGEGGRFRLQELALASVLNFPTAWGRSSSRAFTACSSTTSICRPSWFTAGPARMAYILLLLSTSGWLAHRRFIRTPWQGYAIAAFGAFFGEVAEGFVIDTDHWRHFFLILGMIWGLAAATFRPMPNCKVPAGRPAPRVNRTVYYFLQSRIG